MPIMSYLVFAVKICRRPSGASLTATMIVLDVTSPKTAPPVGDCRVKINVSSGSGISSFTTVMLRTAVVYSEKKEQNLKTFY